MYGEVFNNEFSIGISLLYEQINTLQDCAVTQK